MYYLRGGNPSFSTTFITLLKNTLFEPRSMLKWRGKRPPAFTTGCIIVG